MSTFVIAECGTIHGGDLSKAIALVRIATQVGASVAKFQYWSDSAHLAARRHAPEIAETLERYRMPADWLPRLALACQGAGIEFMTTAYLPEDLPTIAHHVARFKIASFEAQDRAFVVAHKPYGKPTIISTGLMDEAALDWLRDLRDWYFGRWDVRLLLCTSAYPAPMEDVNLEAIRYYDLNGFSDHTESTLTGALAVMAGARIVEKHLRLDDTDPANPDYPHSLPPVAFAEYMENIRVAETALGDGRKRPMASEAPWARYVVAEEPS